jgi:hypothetical protein
MIRALALLTLALASPAGAFQLAFPADCTLGDTCYIQQYADHDPGSGANDYTCGSLSYQGHDGTDIALPSRAAIAAGVNVLAAAPGTVTGTRDGIADFASVVPGKECGNGVIIDHGDGWQTQYCHMKQGSVVVHAGDAVDTGTPLGQIGQTGQAEFPHLHLSLRHSGEKLDPFAPDSLATCGSDVAELWAPPIPYQPGGLIGIGITDAIPEYDAIKVGLASPDLPATAPALVVWAFLYGSQTGDVVHLILTGPEGDVLNEDVRLEKPQAQLFRAVGKKLKADAWPTGSYTGTASLIRNGAEIDHKAITLGVTR